MTACCSTAPGGGMGLPGVRRYGLPYHRRVRVMERLEWLYAIGEGPGANRIGYSPEEDAAHDLARMWMEEAGLEVTSIRPGICSGPTRKGLPRGLDGLASRHRPRGREVRRRARRRRRDRGGRAHRPRLGRRLPRRGARLRREPGAGRGGELPDAFLELHIEQGPRLADAGAPLGIVTGIAGVMRGTIVVEGRAGHAGTTPMGVRDDALVKAAPRDPPDRGDGTDDRGRGRHRRAGRGRARRGQRDPRRV